LRAGATRCCGARLTTLAKPSTVIVALDTKSTEQETGAAASEEASRRLRIFSERLFARLPADSAELFPAEKRLLTAERAFGFFYTRHEPIKVRYLTDSNNGVIVETVMLDCAFIVGSILEYFRANEFPVRILLHPTCKAARDRGGALVSFELAGAGEKRESFTHSELEVAPEPARLSKIETDLRRILAQVAAATADFGAMTARALQICQETADKRELVEIRDFLRWLVHDAFVFLGYRHYRVEHERGQQVIVADGGKSLGIMRAGSSSRYTRPVPLGQLDEAHRRLLFEGSPLIVGKTHAESEVHRRAAMDDITIRRVDQNGQVNAFDRFIGLFTSSAYSEEAQHIPVLRSKLNELLQAEGLQPDMHDYKATVAAFNSFPKEELFRASLSELRVQIRLLLDLQTEDEVRLSLQSDSVRGNVIVLVIMPRQQFSAEVRMRIQAALSERLKGTLVYYYLALGMGYTARLHFCFAAPPPRQETLPLLRAEIASLARSWDSLLREGLTARYSHERGPALAARWIAAFTPRYKNTTSVETALGDIAQVERLLQDGRFSVLIGGAGAEAEQNFSELRLYELGEAPILSELIPTLQNFGISVISEDAHEFRLELDGKAQSANVQAFRVRSAEGGPLEQEPGAALIGDALVAVRTGQAEDDRLNLLTVSAGLSWHEVALLRAYLAAAFQMRLTAARNAAQRPFLSCPQLARRFIELFRARFDPDRDAPPGEAASLRAAYLEQLGAIDNIVDDRMARTLLAMLEATVRTSFFQPVPVPIPYAALKFESGRIANLPDTAPLYELHVNSPLMEGCHLRAGKIARGGIRHSDRPDDYRTEILDLMKTQTVKNAIIVPVGAKGGFIVKPHSGRPPGPQAAIEAYSVLIEAMLDLTDNVAAERRVTPRVKKYDDDGPYLVVAADKGTASYSDTANAIAARRNFWLGDAFASGGEHGYDHKKIGITARGAWESARRHLREMGRDLRGMPVTMVGIGDMSGDVFGNGLLQSDNIKLIAAFDHRHIFIDPDPDPKSSFAERRRLHRLPNSQWSDYAPALISKGGGVFRRGQKRIVMSSQARAALKCDAAEVDADTLIQLILRAEVDMLYNGGIGTYVRSSSETDAQVGDHANDACRITASELRCKIVVEGGNLGLTQKARVEYALRGGRINTDAIDNSAGVDMSDHEVNLKILLQPALARGELSFDERNRQLAAVAEEVARSVLQNNRDQALLLSLEQRRSLYSLSAFREHLTAIEQRGLLRHQDAALPSHEHLRERRAMQFGLTRPELALLTAYTKIDLALRLATMPLVEDSYLIEHFLRPYFPAQIASAYPGEIAHHGLRHELVATLIVNEMVDLMGSLFVFELMRDYGVPEDDAVRAFLIAEGVLDIRERVENLKSGAHELTAEAEIGAFLGLERAVRHACAWALSNTLETGPLGEVVRHFKPGFDQLAPHFETFLARGELARFERTYRELRTAVHHEELALGLTRMSFAQHLLNVLTLSFSLAQEPLEVARIYFGLSEHIEFAMLENAIDGIRTDDRWERRAASDMAAELAWARMQLSRSVLTRDGDKRPLPARLADGRERRAAEVERLMGEMRALPSVELPPLQVAVRALARLAAGT
jgi:glutamate dehydrogenase